MIDKINKALQKNKDQVEKLHKKEKQILETIQIFAARNAKKHDIFEVINYLPGYVRSLTDTYFEIKNIEKENKKLEYFLNYSSETP